MGVLIIIIGCIFVWFGVNYYKKADIASKANPQFSADAYKMSGVFVIFIAIIIIGLGAWMMTWDKPSSTISSSDHSSDHKCAICGKSGARQITNQAGDNNYYCTEHYADAWQHYYGN